MIVELPGGTVLVRESVVAVSSVPQWSTQCGYIVITGVGFEIKLNIGWDQDEERAAETLKRFKAECVTKLLEGR